MSWSNLDELKECIATLPFDREKFTTLYKEEKANPFFNEFPFLKLAVSSNNIEAVDTILSLGACMLCHDMQESNIMFDLLPLNNSEYIERMFTLFTKFFFKTMCNSSDPQQDRTILMEACIRGNFPLVSFLLKNGADPNRTLREDDTDAWTPLHAASARGHASIVRLLLRYGGDRNAAAPYFTSSEKLTPEQVAVDSATAQAFK